MPEAIMQFNMWALGLTLLIAFTTVYFAHTQNMECQAANKVCWLRCVVQSRLDPNMSFLRGGFDMNKAIELTPERIEWMINKSLNKTTYDVD